MEKTSMIVAMTARQNGICGKRAQQSGKSIDEVINEIMVMGITFYSIVKEHPKINGKNVYRRILTPVATEDMVVDFLQSHYKENMGQLYRKVIQYGITVTQ